MIYYDMKYVIYCYYHHYHYYFGAVDRACHEPPRLLRGRDDICLYLVHSEIISWLFGLVVCFALRVREVYYYTYCLHVIWHVPVYKSKCYQLNISISNIY